MRTRTLTALMLAVTVVGCRPTDPDRYSFLPSVGSRVPAFRYTSLDGVPLDASSVVGHPSVIALWSSTCSASRHALRALSVLAESVAARGGRVVVLADDADRTRVDRLVRETGASLTIALAAGTLMDTFTHSQSRLPWRKVLALPTFLVLDAEGRIVHRQIGVELEPRQQLRGVRAAVDSLLAPR
ncbi:MAG: TlpA family protein disulfide reductase [Gemmatimonadaceae bacterium]|jgi:hypothetical protein|nr:TlpA family protein disulfide reductase [Gemmatimonadaceae bacterium]